MGVRSEGNGHSNNWKLLIGLSVLCAVLVFLGGFLHRRALDSAIADRQAKSVAFVNTKVATAAKHADLSAPMKDKEAANFTKELDLPAGTDLRLFSNAGVALYSSPGLASFPADTESIQTAMSGAQGRVIDGSDLRVYTPVDGKGAKPVAIAAVVSNYAQLRHDAAGPLDAVRLPIVGLGIVLLIAGLLLMLQATKGGAAAKAPATSAGKARKTSSSKASASSSKGRVTGFDPVPVTVGRSSDAIEDEPADAVASAVAGEPAPAAEPVVEAKTVFGLRLGSKKDKKEIAAPEDAVVPAEPTTPKPGKARRSLFARKGAPADVPAEAEPDDGKAASALEREVAIRQALEDQLEQLRTRIQMQEVETNSATKELVAQIEAANRRAEEAEARANDAGAPSAPAAPAPAPAIAPDEAVMRVQQLEREIAEARSVTADAVARAEMVQRQLDEAQAAPAAPPADPTAEAKVAEAMAQLTDAQQRAMSAEQRAAAAEQRAASVESVRDELEVRVAQLGTKASDLEQRATELETSLNEANAGGDAVRAEIATLTAALAAANARVTELESAPPTEAHNEDDQAEIARLRGELAKHMERAQAAEDRVTSLEADLLAAQRGVPALDDGSRVDEAVEPVAPAADEVSLASRFESDEPAVETSAPIAMSASVVPDTEPQGPTAEGRGPEVRKAEVHEPEVHEPEVHEPAPTTQEPEVHAPVAHEPVAHEPELSEPEVREPEMVVSAWQMPTQTDPVRSEDEPVATAGVERATPAPSETWSAFHPVQRAEPPSLPPSDAVADEQDHSEPTEAPAEKPDRGDEEPHEPRSIGDGRFEPEPPQTELPEEDPVSAQAAASEPRHEVAHNREPVEAETEHEPPASPEPAQNEPAPTVAWHAPSTTPAVTSPASNGNGIPPAPSDDARYDDIWTAAFAPPEPEAAHEADQQPQDVHPAQAEPQTNGVASALEPPATDVPSDDQPSPPEDEISAEDDMWSLRARLADAAERKRLPHALD